MPNVDLLQRTLAEIEAHPEQWDQFRYDKCFAGTAVRLDGGVWPEGCVVAVVPVPEDPPEIVHNGIVYVDRRAQRILGLTDIQIGPLVFGFNTLDDLRRIVAELTAGA